jgi:CDP-diacylglycerol--glycerol-3-phosphate 3-phosphatidyltransferase
LITGLRLLASSQGHVLGAERLGKHKTSWQIVTVVFFLVLLAARELRYADAHSAWWSRAWHTGGSTLLWVTVALTLYSGLGYAWRHRNVVATNA